MTAEAICRMIPNGLLCLPPRLSLLDEIAYHLDSWEHLAPYFGISSEEQKEISEHYRGYYIIQKQKALRAWRRNLSEKATLESLVVILCKEAQTAVADLGFSKGGFCCSIARKARAKNLRPRPLSVKTTPIFDRFGERLLALPVNP